VIYDEVDTIEVVLQDTTCEYDLMISASLYTSKDSPPDSNGVTTPTLYANAYQVPRKYWRNGMYLRTIIHRKLLSAPDPIGEIIEVDDMYLDKVMADTMDKEDAV
jgi:hypothetical protein